MSYSTTNDVGFLARNWTGERKSHVANERCSKLLHMVPLVLRLNTSTLGRVPAVGTERPGKVVYVGAFMDPS